ncbi:MAG: hypothetical protein V4619_11205 [Bacteroidota bacterium]
MFRLSTLILLVCLFVSCHKGGKEQQQPVCAVKACTKIFVTVGVKFTNAQGDPIAVKNFSAINQRTKSKLVVSSATYDLMPGYFIIANDNTLDQLSTAGDDVLVSADHPVTGEVKAAMFKISGGCNCHVEKLSGPETIVFN